MECLLQASPCSCQLPGGSFDSTGSPWLRAYAVAAPRGREACPEVGASPGHALQGLSHWLVGHSGGTMGSPFPSLTEGPDLTTQLESPHGADIIVQASPCSRSPSLSASLPPPQSSPEEYTVFSVAENKLPTEQIGSSENDVESIGRKWPNLSPQSQITRCKKENIKWPLGKHHLGNGVLTVGSILLWALAAAPLAGLLGACLWRSEELRGHPQKLPLLGREGCGWE